MGCQAAEDRQDISEDYNKHNPVDYKIRVSAKVLLHVRKQAWILISNLVYAEHDTDNSRS